MTPYLTYTPIVRSTTPMPATTDTTQATSDSVAYQLHQIDRLLARMAHLLDAADHPAVHTRACYNPSVQISWGTSTEWVSACDWLTDIKADMTTREVGGGGISDTVILADATIGHINVTFSYIKREA